MFTVFFSSSFFSCSCLQSEQGHLLLYCVILKSKVISHLALDSHNN
uniref:Uncharacterized protein n=1 Tax=Anguilla anguilla TaxID=7936 RepID=A0A0E9UY51_ANGAN